MKLLFTPSDEHSFVVIQQDRSTSGPIKYSFVWSRNDATFQQYRLDTLSVLNRHERVVWGVWVLRVPCCTGEYLYKVKTNRPEGRCYSMSNYSATNIFDKCWEKNSRSDPLCSTNHLSAVYNRLKFHINSLGCSCFFWLLIN
jgi:hypothetical protein